MLFLLSYFSGVTTECWKSFDWAAMERLHTKGLISDRVGKAKSVVFTDEGLRQSEALFRSCSQPDAKLKAITPRSSLAFCAPSITGDPAAAPPTNE
jgi:hypothetical protein